MSLIPAEPTREEARHFARLAQMASDDMFSQFFGSRASAVLESMFRLRDNDGSYVHTAFLLEDDAIAGMLHAYPAAITRQQESRTLWLYLRYAAWQIPRALAQGFLLRDLLDFLGRNLDEGDFYIAFLALYPACRGKGHSKTLLHEAERLGSASGCSHLTLDVDERNEIARAAYHRFGFEQVARSKQVELEGERFGLLRLSKPLTPNPAPTAPAT